VHSPRGSADLEDDLALERPSPGRVAVARLELRGLQLVDATDRRRLAC
jgi:hypothetical protein